MNLISGRHMFLLIDSLRAKTDIKRPPAKIVIVSNESTWTDQCYNWAHDMLAPRLKNWPIISKVSPGTRACPLTMNHPNCLVLVQGVDNSDAIHDFVEKNK